MFTHKKKRINKTWKLLLPIQSCGPCLWLCPLFKFSSLKLNQHKTLESLLFGSQRPWCGKLTQLKKATVRRFPYKVFININKLANHNTKFSSYFFCRYIFPECTQIKICKSNYPYQLISYSKCSRTRMI